MNIITGQYFLNHRLDLKEIEWQVRELAAKGYQGVYPHARQGLLTPYFSNDWWQAVDMILDVCRRTGMTMWIWDEDYFPSGLAGGRIVWEDPGLIARGLEFTIKQVEGSAPFEVDFASGMLLRAFALARNSDGTFGESIDITAACGTRRQTWTDRHIQHGAYSPQIGLVGHPHWRCTMTDNRFAAIWTPPRPGSYTILGVTVRNTSGVHPDMLNPQSVRRFIDMCYEPYNRRYGQEFGSLIKGAFTDEPSPGGFLYPWTLRFADEFQADHGYDLLDHLPHLALDIGDRSPMVRHHYRLTQHRLQEANYIGQLARWCADHRIAFYGHLTRTEWLSVGSFCWPNELRCYRQMAIPSADPLTGSCSWKDAAAYHTGLKVASSAAHLFGKAQAGSDALAVMGDETCIRDLKYVLDYQMVLGINHFILHGLSYSLDGPRKDEVPPSIFYQHTEWKHMKVLLDHVRSTAEALTGGQHLCQLAVLYPSTSLACQFTDQTELWGALPDESLIHGLVDELLSHQKDFDLIDEITLQEQIDANGKITTREDYRTVILPHVRYLDARTAEALGRFSKAGGQVWAIGQKPRAITSDLNEPLKDWMDGSIHFSPTLEPAILDVLPGPQITGEGARDVFVLRRSKDNQPLTFLFNRRERSFEGTIDGVAVSLPPRGSLLIRGVPESEKKSTPAEVSDLSIGWEVTFEPNQLPLSFWHAISRGGELGPSNFVYGPGYDLLARQKDPCEGGEEPVCYYSRFMLTDPVPDARLVLEDAAITGNWKLFVNDTPITDWQRAIVYDCRNLVTSVGHALRSGSTPTANIIRIETDGKGRGLKEIPYLYGSFACEFRYGHSSFPFVRGTTGPLAVSLLQPWSSWGYPTFSGSARYARAVSILRAGDYLLDLGRVEDVAAVRWDGQETMVLAWPPYSCRFQNLTAGTHQLEIEVTNAPANRNRVAHLPAGLLGPVRLFGPI